MADNPLPYFQQAKDPLVRKQVLLKLRQIVEDPYSQQEYSPEVLELAKKKLFDENKLERAAPQAFDPLPRGMYPLTNVVGQNTLDVERGLTEQGPGYAAQHPFKTAGWLASPITTLPALALDAFSAAVPLGKPAIQSINIPAFGMEDQNPQLTYLEKVAKYAQDPESMSSPISTAERAPALINKYMAQGMSYQDAERAMQRDIFGAAFKDFAADAATIAVSPRWAKNAAQYAGKLGMRGLNYLNKKFDPGQYFRKPVATTGPRRTAAPHWEGQSPVEMFKPSARTRVDIADANVADDAAMAQEAAERAAFENDVPRYMEIERQKATRAGGEEARASVMAEQRALVPAEPAQQTFDLTHPQPPNWRSSYVSPDPNAPNVIQQSAAVPESPTQMTFGDIQRQSMVRKPGPQVPNTSPDSPEALDYITRLLDSNGQFLPENARKVVAMSSAQRAEMLKMTPQQVMARDVQLAEQAGTKQNQAAFDQWMRRPDAPVTHPGAQGQQQFNFLEEVGKKPAGGLRDPIGTPMDERPDFLVRDESPSAFPFPGNKQKDIDFPLAPEPPKAPAAGLRVSGQKIGGKDIAYVLDKDGKILKVFRKDKNTPDPMAAAQAHAKELDPSLAIDVPAGGQKVVDGVLVGQSKKGKLIFQKVGGDGKYSYLVVRGNGAPISEHASIGEAQKAIYTMEGGNSVVNINRSKLRGAPPGPAATGPSAPIPDATSAAQQAVTKAPASAGGVVADRAFQFVSNIKMPAKLREPLLKAISSGDVGVVSKTIIDNKLISYFSDKEYSAIMKMTREARGAQVKVKARWEGKNPASAKLAMLKKLEEGKKEAGLPVDAPSALDEGIQKAATPTDEAAIRARIAELEAQLGEKPAEILDTYVEGQGVKAPAPVGPDMGKSTKTAKKAAAPKPAEPPPVGPGMATVKAIDPADDTKKLIQEKIDSVHSPEDVQILKNSLAKTEAEALAKGDAELLGETQYAQQQLAKTNVTRPKEKRGEMQRMADSQRSAIKEERAGAKEAATAFQKVLAKQKAEAEALLAAKQAEKPGVKTAAKNLGKVIKGTKIVKEKGSGGGMRSFTDPFSAMVHQVTKDLRIRLTPEATEAWGKFLKEDLPGIAREAKASGQRVEDIIARDYAKLTPDEARLASALAARHVANTTSKFHTLNMAKVPEGQQQQIAEVARDNPELSMKTEKMPRSEQIAAAGKEGTADLAERLAEPSAAGAGHAPMIKAMQILDDVSSGKAKWGAETRERIADQLRTWEGIGTTTARIMQGRTRGYASLVEARDILQALADQGKIPRSDYAAISAIVGKLDNMNVGKRVKFLRMLHEYGINNILSGPMTAYRNIAGMSLGTGLALADRVGTGAFNKFIARPTNVLAETAGLPKPFNKNIDKRMREVIPLAKGLVKGAPEGFKRAMKYFMHETDGAVLKSFGEDMKAIQASQTMTPVQKRAAMLSIRRERDRFVEQLATSENRMAELGLLHRRATPGKVGKVINTPVLGLKAADEGVGAMLIRGFEDSIKARVGAAQGVSPDKVKLTAEQIAEILADADYYLFKTRAPVGVRGLMAAAAPDTALGYTQGQVLMFMKTNYNLLKVSTDHTPIGVLTSILDTEKPVLAALRDSDTWGKALVGTAATYGAYDWLDKNHYEMHGSAVSREEKAARVAAGLPLGPFILKPNGKDYWDFSNIMPAQLFVEGMAAWQSGNRQQEATGDRLNAGDRSGRMSTSMLNAAMNASSMAGAKALNTAISVAKEWDPKEHPGEMNPLMTWLARSAAARLIPASGFQRDVVRKLDPVSRQSSSAKEVFQEQMVGQSTKVKPRYTWSGERAQKNIPGMPFEQRTVSKDPVAYELMRIGYYPKDVPDDSKGVPMTIEHRDEVKRTFGPMAKDMMRGIVESPGYETLPEAMKYKIVEGIDQSVRSGEREFAQALMLAAQDGAQALVQKLLQQQFKNRSMEQPRRSGYFPYLD